MGCQHCISGLPDMKVEGRWFNDKGRHEGLAEIERHGMVGSRTDAGHPTRKAGRDRAVNMPGCHETDIRMAQDNRAKCLGVPQSLPIHMPDPGSERRVVQEQQRRSPRVLRERRFKPSKG